MARRPTGQTGANPAVSAAAAAAAVANGKGAHETNRALPKLPRAPLPPPEEPNEDAADLDVAIDEIEKALAPEPSASSLAAVNTGQTEPTAPRVPPNQLPAICTFGRFEILGRIAFGGMAEIFLGRESTNIGATRMLAIKRILPHVADDPSFVEMFLDEARLAILLNHPHICHIYEFGELESSYFIAMEWIYGAAFGKIIRRARAKGGLPPEFVAKVVAQVAEALHYAHRAKDSNGTPLNIVHRDVSPQNVMISYEGQVKLLDFGIAKAGSHTTKTQAGVVKGKFSYMSPQQCMGKHIDHRADVFALGVVLYEALVGESLYHRPTEYETMRAVIEDPVPSIRDKKPKLPIELDAIVQKALQKQPEDRFKTASDMQNALEDWIARSGKVVTTSRIADVMEKLFEEQIAAGPLVDSTPFGSSFQRRKGIDGSSPSGIGLIGSNPSSSGLSGAGPASVATGDRLSMPGSELPLDPNTFGAEIAAAAADARPAPAQPPIQQPSYAALQLPLPAAVAPAQSDRGGALSRWLPTVLALVAVLLAGVIAVVVIGGRDEGRTVTITQVTPPPTTTAVIPPPTVPPATTEVATPPATSLPPATEGSLRFVLEGSSFEGATIRVGDRTLTAAELAAPLAMAAGTFTVHVEREGYRTWENEIVVSAGRESSVTPELVRESSTPRTPAAPPATLSINTRPWSRVWIGSRELGTTPIGEATVPSGTVRLRIVDRDGRTFNRSVRVAAGATENVFFDLDAE
ncbi:MAG: serine/threonine protein kinase [Deltaproteobacteria bacterium]|nr:serine/threonine protein kinase [Deltaproteobacteria bacterium]